MSDRSKVNLYGIYHKTLKAVVGHYLVIVS